MSALPAATPAAAPPAAPPKIFTSTTGEHVVVDERKSAAPEPAAATVVVVPAATPAATPAAPPPTVSVEQKPAAPPTPVVVEQKPATAIAVDKPAAKVEEKPAVIVVDEKKEAFLAPLENQIAAFPSHTATTGTQVILKYPDTVTDVAGNKLFIVSASEVCLVHRPHLLDH